MIASWMIYAMVVGVLLSMAALLAERSLVVSGRPVRGIWTAALLLSILVPAVSPQLPGHPSLSLAQGRKDAMAESGALVSGEHAAREAERHAATGSSVFAPFRLSANTAFLSLWVTGSSILALLLLYSIGVLQGRRREWRREQLDGVSVLVSRDVGPAVIGWRRIEIVIPEWVRELEGDARALVLRHEREHVVRKDPRHLLGAYVALILMPWNPALWWQLRRLRRAIELDCDARVVASGVSWARYGKVLLEAVGRCHRVGLPAFAAFAERTSDLEARLHALGTERPVAWRRQARNAAFAATALLVAACFTPDAVEPSLRSAPDQPSPSKVADIIVREREIKAPPQDILVLYKGPDGQEIGSEMMRVPRDRSSGGSPGFRATLAKDIESIEVVKGKVVGVEGVDAMIVIMVKAGAVPALRERLSRPRQQMFNELRHILRGERNNISALLGLKLVRAAPANDRVP